MLNCHGCLRRALRAAIAEARPRLQNDAAARPFTQFRSFSRSSPGAASVAGPSRATPPAGDLGEVDDDPKSSRPRRANANRQSYAADILRPSAEQLRSAKAAALRELPWRKDPYELGKYVRGRLQNAKTPREVLNTLELVRAASKHMSCVVCWNFIIDHFLSKGEVDAALKIYNEMKKRAQFPIEHTYGILLRGFAELVEKNPSVKNRALAIYRARLAPDAKVKSNAQITATLLNVLANAGDLDSMWDVLSKLPETGENAPTAVTYATVLKTLRQNVVANVAEGQSTTEVPEATERAIEQAQQIWSDVMARWRRGERVMDQVLVASMCNVLLLSGRQSDAEEVLNIVEEVAQIPKQLSLRQQSRARAASPTQLPEESQQELDKSFLKPSYITLTVILKACSTLRQWNAGIQYWDILVTGQGDRTNRQPVKPDSQSYFEYLRILRAARSSSRTVTALEHMKKSGLLSKLSKRDADKVFKIALPACWRNTQSPHAMRDAAGMYKLMMEMLDPASQTCSSMLNITRLMQSHANDVESVVETLRLMILGPNSTATTVDKKQNLILGMAKAAAQDAAKQEQVVFLARQIVRAVHQVFKELDSTRHRTFLESVESTMSNLVGLYMAPLTPEQRQEKKAQYRFKDMEKGWEDGFGAAFPGEVDWTPMAP